MKNNYLRGFLKRIFDLVISLILILISFPIVFIFLFLIWMQDFCNPIYFSKRVGKNEKEITVYKMRSMIKGAEKSGISSTTLKDKRITKIGNLIRKLKIDELLQLINKLKF